MEGEARGAPPPPPLALVECPLGTTVEMEAEESFSARAEAGMVLLASEGWREGDLRSRLTLVARLGARLALAEAASDPP